MTPPPQRPAAIVFDKDGTLFDFAKTWEVWARAFLDQISPNADVARQVGQRIGYDYDQSAFENDSVVIAGSTDDVVALALPLLPMHTHRSLTEIINREAARAPQVEAVPLPPLLSRLKDRQLILGVATNDAEISARAHLDAKGAAAHFDFIAGYDSGFGAKPGPGQLRAFAKEFALSPERCVMVGDSLHDLHAGRAAGFMTVGVLTGYASPADLAPFADIVLPDIGHLPDWIDLATG